MEGGLVQHRPKIVGSLSNKVINKKRVKKRSSLKGDNVQICVPLQKLYGCCQRVFKGPGVVPSSHDVHSLCSILDGMKPEDLGLSKDLPFFNPGNCFKENPRVTCTTVYRCRNFSLILFFLPASAVIPLHNHPEMTVFSKLLLGTMHIKAYDWAYSLNSQCDEQLTPLKLAKLKANSVFTAPCNTTVLYPTSGGNIHAFTAITPCAVLDVLGPPYSKEDGRDCTYYKDSPFTFSGGELSSEVKDKDNDQSYGWLEEIEEPEHSKMVAIPYLGPTIVETAT